MSTTHTNPDGSVVTITIGDRAKIGAGATIGAWATIGAGARIGDRATIALLGADDRGYEFHVALVDGGVVIFSGCRWFSLAQARAHWGAVEYPDKGLGQEALERVAMGERIARLRGWPVDPVPTEGVAA